MIRTEALCIIGIEKVLISSGSLLYLLTKTWKILNSGVRVMVLNATFNNISVIWWRSVLLVEETGENH
jgi:hypothetical protein